MFEDLGNPYARDPIDRGYRIMAFASAIQGVVDGLEGTAVMSSRMEGINHIARAIYEEAFALVDRLESVGTELPAKGKRAKKT